MSDAPITSEDKAVERVVIGCCDLCWNSKYALKGKNKTKFGCGLACECHLARNLPKKSAISTHSKVKEESAVAFVHKSQAIDYTDIYYIETTQTIRKGTLLRFDTAENLIRKAPKTGAQT